MKWKIEAKNDLRHYNETKHGVESTAEQIRTLKAEIESVRSAAADGTAVHGGGNAREDAMLNNIMKRGKLEDAHKIASARLDTINRGLAVLDETERLVLDRFYINNHKGHVERLCEEMHLERSRVYEIHDVALEKFTRAMYGVLET